MNDQFTAHLMQVMEQQLPRVREGLITGKVKNTMAVHLH
jgi:hypothetical protein